MSHKKIASAGFTLIELLVSLAIVGIMATGILVYMQNVFKSQAITYHLAQRTQKVLIMKAALDNTASAAGSIAAPTISNAKETNGNQTTPFNLFGAIGSFLYGNCPSSGIFGNVYSALNNAGNNFIDDIFFGGYGDAHTTATGGNTELTSVTIPSPPLAITASTISFDWLTVHAKGGVELCQGTLHIQGNILTYQVTGSAKSGYSECGAIDGSNNASTSYPIGKGWSFSGPVQNAACLGSAYPETTPEAIVAKDASAHGLNPTEVSVCLPAM
ncbi:type II secretion system protein [Acidithiobacillus thiooxidans]|jgi:prepilin-type N-terminal cleavage/methylation domain-containing protein|uniref:type II secretion system protein n=1 Tax=Acidithiobacillus thiooxidans TaxID=930 RepID=UPI001C065384|nr:type II secretion system protein [Acidithiobacillus thiooxidans]MBU2834200.1 type II secretion system protein [Acidithiobacillus thiooxidans]